MDRGAAGDEPLQKLQEVGAIRAARRDARATNLKVAQVAEATALWIGCGSLVVLRRALLRSNGQRAPPVRLRLEAGPSILLRPTLERPRVTTS